MPLVFETCCGCVDLRKGCFIIGCLNLVYGVVVLILDIVGFVALLHVIKDLNDKTIIGLFAFFCIIIGIYIIFSALLLAGLHQNRSQFVKAYVIFNILFLVLFLISSLLNINKVDIGTTIGRIISVILNAYCTLVVRSYYLKMVAENHSAQSQPNYGQRIQELP